ncbi:NCA2-domain-containing protein [Trametopsis cervina]|nr:NCA2-domain-containing protein [Trametopsis cervina]
MSTFIHEVNQELTSRLLTPASPSLTASSASLEASDSTKNALRECFADLPLPLTPSDIEANLQVLYSLMQEGVFGISADGEQQALEAAIIAKVVTGIYLQTLEETLDEARRADSEVEWWTEIERSRLKSAYYLLQTLPDRLRRVADTIVEALRTRRLPLRLSAFSPSSIRQLFPTTNILQANTLTIAVFPHLKHQPYPTYLLPGRHRDAKTSSLVYRDNAVRSLPGTVFSYLDHTIQSLSAFIHLPVELTRHECTSKREHLERIRDERATTIGKLLDMQKSVAECIATSTTKSSASAVQQLSLDLEGSVQWPTKSPIHTTGDVILYLRSLATETLPRRREAYSTEMFTLGLNRPSWLVLNWPRIVFLPPVLLYSARAAYTSRASLEQVARDTVDTLKHFWEDWLLSPLRDVIQTVRAGNDEGVIITHESVKADLDSLERMTLSLAQDRLRYTPEQMDALSQQIRVGDLTAVMQIYEDDIRSPLKSAVAGSLLRTLLVQVQKAKVDINQAVSGIDKLLKSQELTFAFVGVAPAMTIAYITLGYLRSLWFGSKGRSRYGGRKRCAGVWQIMRRVERLLINNHQHKDNTTIEPRVTGLLLLGTTQLRHYAEHHLPKNSRIREGFLQDVKDLENSSMGRTEKLRVVDRMWKSWGDVLGWRQVAAM